MNPLKITKIFNFQKKSRLINIVRTLALTLGKDLAMQASQQKIVRQKIW